MLLFEKRFHEALVRGDVTPRFRRWDRPHASFEVGYELSPRGRAFVAASARRKT